jgi:tetratricopeptide (TPR) repeat protein
MSIVAATLAAHCLLVTSPQEPEAQEDAQSQEVAREGGVHNYLVTRFHVLKQGRGIDGVRAEITSEVNLSGLSEESLALLRRALEVCNKAALRAADAEGERKQASGSDDALGKLLLFLATGGQEAITVPIVLGLLGNPASEEAGNTQSPHSEALRADLANLEFDLAIYRSRLQAEHGVPADQLLRSQDYDQYTAALQVEGTLERLAMVASAHTRSPWLQPATLYLADHWLRAGYLEESTELASLALDASPVILRRDPLRVWAYRILAESVRPEAPEKALQWANAGLAEDPAYIPLLTSKVSAMIALGDHAGVYPVLRQLDLLRPQTPWVLYNLACCQAVVDEDA